MPANSPSTKPRDARKGSPNSAMPSLAPVANAQPSTTTASGLDSPQATLSSLSAASLRKGSDVVLPPQLRGTSESIHSSNSSNRPSPTLRTSPSASATNRSTANDGTARASRDANTQPSFSGAAPHLAQVPTTKSDTGRVFMPTAKSFNDTGYDRVSAHQTQKRTTQYMAASMELPVREIQEMSLHSLPAMQPSAISAFRGSSRTASKTSSLAPSPSSVFTVPGSHPAGCSPALELADLDTVLYNAGSISLFEDDLQSPQGIPPTLPRASDGALGTDEELPERVRSGDRTPSSRHLQALADQAQFMHHLASNAAVTIAPTQPSEGSETSESPSTMSKVRLGKRSTRPVAQRAARRLKKESHGSGTSSSSHSGSADSSVNGVCRNRSPFSNSDYGVAIEKRKKKKRNGRWQNGLHGDSPTQVRKTESSHGANEMQGTMNEGQSAPELSPFADFRRHHRRQQQQQQQQQVPLESSPTASAAGSGALAPALELHAACPQPPLQPPSQSASALRGNTVPRGSMSRDTLQSESDDSHSVTPSTAANASNTRRSSGAFLASQPAQIISVPFYAFSLGSNTNNNTSSSSKDESINSKRDSVNSNLSTTPLLSSFSPQLPSRAVPLPHDQPLVDLFTVPYSRPASRLQNTNASSLNMGGRDSVVSPPNLSATNMWGSNTNNSRSDNLAGATTSCPPQPQPQPQKYAMTSGCARLAAPRMVTQTRTEIVSHDLVIPVLSEPHTEASCGAAGGVQATKCAPVISSPSMRRVSSLVQGTNNTAPPAHTLHAPSSSSNKRIVVKERPKSAKRNSQPIPSQRTPSSDSKGKRETTALNQTEKMEPSGPSDLKRMVSQKKKKPAVGMHSTGGIEQNNESGGEPSFAPAKPQPSLRQTTACASTSFSSGNLHREGSTLSSAVATPLNASSPSATQLSAFHFSGLADFGSLRNHGSTASMDRLGVLRGDQYGGSSFFCGFRRLDSGINGEYANASFSRASEQSKSGNISHARLLFTSDHIPPVSHTLGAGDASSSAASPTRGGGHKSDSASTRKGKGDGETAHGKKRTEASRQGDGGADGRSTDSENDGASASFSDEESDSGASCVSSKDLDELLAAIRRSGMAAGDPSQQASDPTPDSQRDVAGAPVTTVETNAQRRPLKSFFRLYYLPYDRYNRPKNPMTVLMAGAYRNSPPPVSAATQPPPPPSPWSFRRQGERKPDVLGGKSPAPENNLHKLSSGTRLNSVSGLASLHSDELLAKPNWKSSTSDAADNASTTKNNRDSPQKPASPNGIGSRRRSAANQSPGTMSIAALCSPNSDALPNGGMFSMGVPQSSFTTASLQSFAGNSPSCGFPYDASSAGPDGGGKTPQDSTTFYPFFSTAGRIAVFERHGTSNSGATSNMQHHPSYGQSLASVCSSAATMDGFYGTPTSSAPPMPLGVSSPDRARRRKQTASPGLPTESVPPRAPSSSSRPPSDASSPKSRPARADEQVARITKENEGDGPSHRNDSNKPERLSFDSSAVMFRPKRQSSVTSESKGAACSPPHGDSPGKRKNVVATQKTEDNAAGEQPLPVNESLQSLQGMKQLGTSNSVTLSSAPRFSGMHDALVGFEHKQSELVSGGKTHPEPKRQLTLQDLDCLGEMVTGTISTSSDNAVAKALVYDPESPQFQVMEKGAGEVEERDSDLQASSSSSSIAANSQPDTSMDSFRCPFASTARETSGFNMPTVLQTKYSSTVSSLQPSPKAKTMLSVPMKVRTSRSAGQDALPTPPQDAPNGPRKPSDCVDSGVNQSDSQIGSLTSPTPPNPVKLPGSQCPTCGSPCNMWGETLCNCSPAAPASQPPWINGTAFAIPNPVSLPGEALRTSSMSSRPPALESPTHFASKSHEQQQQQQFSGSFPTKAARERGENTGSVYASVDAATFARAAESSYMDRLGPRGQSCRVTPLHGDLGQGEPQPHMVFHSQRGSWRNNVKSIKNDSMNAAPQRGSGSDNVNFYYYYYMPNQRAWGSFSARGGASVCADGDCPRGAVSVATPTLSSRSRPQPHFGSAASCYPTSPVIASPLPGIPQFASRPALESGGTAESRSNGPATQRTTYQRNPSWQIQSVSSTLSSLSFSRSQRHGNQSWSFSVQKPLREQECDSFIEMERKPQPNIQEVHSPMDLSRGVINLHGTMVTPIQAAEAGEGFAEMARGGGAVSPRSTSFRRKSVSPSNQRRAVSFKGFPTSASGPAGPGQQNTKPSSPQPLLGADRPYPSREPTPRGDATAVGIQLHSQEDPPNSTYDRVPSSGNVESILMKHPQQSWRSVDGSGSLEPRRAPKASQGRVSPSSTQQQASLKHAKGGTHERRHGGAADNTPAAREDPFARHFPKQIGSYDVPPRRERHGSDETQQPHNASNESSSELAAKVGGGQEPHSPRSSQTTRAPADLELCPAGQDLATFLTEQQAIQRQQKVASHVLSARSQAADSSILSAPPQLHRTDPLTVSDPSEDHGYNAVWVGSARGYGAPAGMEIVPADEQPGVFHLPLVLHSDEENDVAEMMGYHEDDDTGMGFMDPGMVENETMHGNLHFRRDGSYSRNNMSPCFNGSANNYIPMLSMSQAMSASQMEEFNLLSRPVVLEEPLPCFGDDGMEHEGQGSRPSYPHPAMERLATIARSCSTVSVNSSSYRSTTSDTDSGHAHHTSTATTTPTTVSAPRQPQH